jgi:hypothetical protein
MDQGGALRAVKDGRRSGEGARKGRRFPGPLRRYVVFISYDSSDRWIASVLAEKIALLGAEPWFDVKSLEAGQVIVSGILEGVWACQEAVILVTPASIDSQWVSFELGAARVLGKLVTPIFYGVDPASLKPAADLKHVELNDFATFCEDLASRIRKPEES